ncbi:hypothetical protein CKA32_006591 [Geitlerinema sp. FC II]|nr:hypothetical protein CKA32_006591 [Geitlerinema sp. FC II]
MDFGNAAVHRWSDGETQQQLNSVQRLRSDKFTFLRCTLSILLNLFSTKIEEIEQHC